MNKVQTHFVLFEDIIYFCYDSDEYWFETDYCQLDVMSKDMIEFAYNYIQKGKKIEE